MNIFKKLRKKKPVEQICKNCRLYSSKSSTCHVRILHQGITFRDVPVDPKDKCLWEELGVAEQIKEARFWTEDEAGNPTKGNGTVKVEYSPGFFGTEEAEDE